MRLKDLILESKDDIRDLKVNVSGHKNQLEEKIETRIYKNSLVNLDAKRERGKNTQQITGYHWGKNKQVFGKLSLKK